MRTSFISTLERLAEKGVSLDIQGVSNLEALVKNVWPDVAETGEWDREFDQRLFAWAAEQVRGSFQDATWQAFWQTAVDGKKPAESNSGIGIVCCADEDEWYDSRTRHTLRLSFRPLQWHSPRHAASRTFYGNL